MASGLDPFSGLVPFVATAEARSFREAAQRLGVTASAVSKAIARLEAELGVRLMHRTSRRVTLTTEGEAFFQRCRDALDRARAAREIVSEAQRAPRGVLRVSLPLPLGRVVMPALPRLLTRYPALSVEVVLTDRFVHLTEENVDVAVRVGQVEESRAVGKKLRALRWSTAAAPSYLARQGTPASPADLAGHNCLKFILPSGLPNEWVFGAAAKPSPVRVRGNLAADHGDSLVAAARAGVGIVQALDFMVAAEIQRGELIEVLRDHAAPGPPMTALTAPGRHTSAKVRAFMGFIQEVMS